MNNNLMILAIFVGSTLLITLLGGCVNCPIISPKMEGMRNRPPATVQQTLPPLPSVGSPIAPQKPTQVEASAGIPSGFDYSDITMGASDVSNAFEGSSSNGVSGTIARDVASNGSSGRPILSNN